MGASRGYGLSKEEKLEERCPGALSLSMPQFYFRLVLPKRFYQVACRTLAAKSIRHGKGTVLAHIIIM